jgi:hypothetical protein
MPRDLDIKTWVGAIYVIRPWEGYHASTVPGIDANNYPKLWVTEGTAAGTHELSGTRGALSRRGNPSIHQRQ